LASPDDPQQPLQGITRELLEADGLRRALLAHNPDAEVFDDDHLRASIERTLALAPPDSAPEAEGVWVFGYGSLPWNPCIEVAAQAPALVHGYHRDFCLWDIEGRGSRQSPGLTLALAPGGACHAIALRIPPAPLRYELLLLWRREMVTNVYEPRWVRMRMQGGAVAGIAFVVNRSHPAYTGRLTEQRVAHMLASGEGPLGRAVEYIERTMAQLRAHGLDDRRLARIEARALAVAAGR